MTIESFTWKYKYSISPEVIIEIQDKYNSTRAMSTKNPDKWTYEKLMAEYQISRSTVYRALHDENYYKRG
ncbi:MAG: hypothetical protein ABL876_00005, partial [Chitinophagaceae bacterium]